MTERAHEWIDFGLDVREVSDLCVKQGVIIQAYPEANRADVEIEGAGRVNGVGIFYHCPESTSVKDGGYGFKDDLPVVLIQYRFRRDQNIGYVIVSPQEGLRECLITHMFLCGANRTRGITYSLSPDSTGDFQEGQTLTVETEKDGAQSFTIDKIIPEPIPLGQRLLLGEVPLEARNNNPVSSSTASGKISQSLRLHYRYVRSAITIPMGTDTVAYTPEQLDYTVPAPTDWDRSITDLSVTDPSVNPIPSVKTWAKTLEDVTVEAVRITSPALLLPMWKIMATYKGRPITFQGGFSTAPKEAGIFTPMGTVRYHLGFDVWRADDGTYRIGIAQDSPASIEVWAINPDVSLEAEVAQTHHIESKFLDDEDYDKNHVRLCGFGDGTAYYFRHTVLWTANAEGDLQKETKPNGKSIQTAVWNHATNELLILGVTDQVTVNDGDRFLEGPSVVTHGGGTPTNLSDKYFERWERVLWYQAGYLSRSGGIQTGVFHTVYRMYFFDQIYRTLYPDYDIDRFEFNGGQKRAGNEGNYERLSIQGDGNYWTADGVTSGICIPKDAYRYMDWKFVFTPDGSVAGTANTEKLVQKVDPFDERGTICEWEEAEGVEFGDPDLQQFALGWPYEGWKAVLKSGDGCAGPVTSPMVAYGGGGVVKTPYSYQVIPEVTKDRVFFTRFPVPTKCPEE